jgi:hypothetical protein
MPPKHPMTPKQVLLPYAATSLPLVISEIINLYIKQISPNYLPSPKNTSFFKQVAKALNPSIRLLSG